MKRIAIVLGLAFAGLSISTSCDEPTKVQMGERTTMKVNAVYDAKKVAVGEVIKAKFTVENTGDVPLVLSDVRGSCSCTVADFPKEPIAPGKSGVIKATVDTKAAAVGHLEKSVRISANTSPELTVVSIQATIIR